MPDASTVQCPYCWQTVDIFVDISVPQQKYIEDCAVCCRPMVIHVEVGEYGDVNVHAKPEDDV